MLRAKFEDCMGQDFNLLFVVVLPARTVASSDGGNACIGVGVWRDAVLCEYLWCDAAALGKDAELFCDVAQGEENEMAAKVFEEAEKLYEPFRDGRLEAPDGLTEALREAVQTAKQDQWDRTEYE